MRITRTSAIIFAILITLSLSACRAPASEKNEGNTSDVQEKQAPTIKVITTKEFETPLWGKLLKIMGENKSAPNVKMDIEYVPFAELDKKITVTNAAAQYYDLLTVNNTSVEPFVKLQMLECLDTYFSKAGIDSKKKFVSGITAATYVGGKMYCVPIDTDCRILAVNKKMLQEEGLENPKTKEDMLKIAKAVTKDLNHDGTIDQYGYLMNLSRTLPSIYIQGGFLLGNGVRVYDEVDGKLVSKMNNDAGKDYVKWAIEMAKYMPKDFYTYDNTMINSLFAQGKSAMLTFIPANFSDQGFQDQLAKNSVQYELITNPIGTAKSGSAVGGWTMGIGSKSANKDAVWGVLNFMTQPEINAGTAPSLPVVEEAYKFPPFNDPKYKTFAEQLKTAEVPVPRVTPDFNSIADVWGNSFTAAVLGKSTVDGALKEAEDGINAILKKSGYQ